MKHLSIKNLLLISGIAVIMAGCCMGVENEYYYIPDYEIPYYEQDDTLIFECEETNELDTFFVTEVIETFNTVDISSSTCERSRVYEWLYYKIDRNPSEPEINRNQLSFDADPYRSNPSIYWENETISEIRIDTVFKDVTIGSKTINTFELYNTYNNINYTLSINYNYKYGIVQYKMNNKTWKLTELKEEK